MAMMFEGRKTAVVFPWFFHNSSITLLKRMLAAASCLYLWGFACSAVAEDAPNVVFAQSGPIEIAAVLTKDRNWREMLFEPGGAVSFTPVTELAEGESVQLLVLVRHAVEAAGDLVLSCDLAMTGPDGITQTSAPMNCPVLPRPTNAGGMYLAGFGMMLENGVDDIDGLVTLQIGVTDVKRDARATAELQITKAGAK